MKELAGPLQGRTVAVWGLTYKPGTDTLRRSMSVELCDALLAQGVRLQVHDPAVGALPAQWDGRVQRFDNPADALASADALVVATQWPDYREIDPASQKGLRDGFIVLDANRFLPAWSAIASVRYASVGAPVVQGARA